MGEFSGVFFEVGVFYSYFCAVGEFNLPFTNDRFVELGDLIAFGEIRIVVVFAVKAAVEVDVGTQCKADLDGFLDGFLIEAREHAREGVADGADTGVGLFVVSIIIYRSKKLGFGI
jgi:hypothetical protein